MESAAGIPKQTAPIQTIDRKQNTSPPSHDDRAASQKKARLNPRGHGIAWPGTVSEQWLHLDLLPAYGRRH